MIKSVNIFLFTIYSIFMKGHRMSCFENIDLLIGLLYEYSLIPTICLRYNSIFLMQIDGCISFEIAG